MLRRIQPSELIIFFDPTLESGERHKNFITSNFYKAYLSNKQKKFVLWSKQIIFPSWRLIISYQQKKIIYISEKCKNVK